MNRPRVDDPDKSRGLIEDKFIVKRTDPKSREKHKDCEFFVLDVNHDAYAKAALEAYADACEVDYPLLASDIRSRYL